MKAFYELIEHSARIFPCINLTFPEHLHKEVEMIYVEEGEVSVTIGKSQKLLSAGELGIVFPNTVHSYEAKRNYCGSLLIFSPDMAGDFAEVMMAGRCSMPFLDTARLKGDVVFCLERLKQPDIRNNLPLMKGYLTVLTGNLLSDICLETGHETQSTEMSEIVLRYIMLHYREKITLSSLSAKTGFGKYAISRFFNQELGCGFNDYLNTLRIGYAQHLLGNRKFPVTEIALESGFLSLRSFNRAFRSIHGFSPSEYRKKIKVPQNYQPR